jgi:hypothetical protein
VAKSCYHPRMNRPSQTVAVLMRRERITGPMARWQPWRWVLADVVPHEEGFGSAPRCLLRTNDEQRWLFPGHEVALFSDDGEGYWLNVTSPTPCWFVLWRTDEASGDDGYPMARPEQVSLSYHDAGRWLDAQETVDQIPAAPEVVAWITDFTNQHYTPEVKKRQRPQSFQALTDRFGQPASVSTRDRRSRRPPGGESV